MKQKTKQLILTLVALLAVTAGAWADETLLLTIESKDYKSFKSGSMTFDDKVTITFSNSVRNDGDNWGWYVNSSASLLTVAGINGYTITSCKFYVEVDGIAKTGYTVQGESPSVYLSDLKVYTDNSQSVKIGANGVTKIEVYEAAASDAPASDVTVAWDKAEKTGSFTMPGGNVIVEPEYYPQAALTAAPTAINDVPATTDGAIVEAGTVANIGETTTAQGTVMYYAVQSATAPTAPDYDATGWTDKVPTATDFAEGNVYVWYYIKGAEPASGTDRTDANTCSDSEITALGTTGYVTLAAPPTYAITLKEGTEDVGEWTISPAEATKGTTITATYSGTKRVKSVKAVKKGGAAGIVNPVVGQIIGSDGKNYDANATLPTGVTAVAVIAYVGSETGDDTYKNGLAIALADEGSMNWSTAMSTCGAKTAITGAKWCLPSQEQWKQMFKANGGDYESYTRLNITINNAGGTILQEGADYWSSSESDPGSYAYVVNLDSDIADWHDGTEGYDGRVRACLAF